VALTQLVHRAAVSSLTTLRIAGKATRIPSEPWRQDLLVPANGLRPVLLREWRGGGLARLTLVCSGSVYQSNGSWWWWLISSFERSFGFHGRLWGVQLWCDSGPRRPILHVAPAFSSGAWAWRESGMVGLGWFNWPGPVVVEIQYWAKALVSACGKVIRWRHLLAPLPS
jgi:hypothetical protein